MHTIYMKVKSKKKIMARKKTKHTKKNKKITFKSKKNKQIDVLIKNIQFNKNHVNPIIGVITMPVVDKYKTKVTSYLPSSYVKWIESSGARVVPLQYDLPKPILKALLSQINGVLLIGGDVENKKYHNMLDSKIYTGFCKYIYDYVKEQNDLGNYYPIFGICLGFQTLAMLGYFNTAAEIDKDFVNHEILGKYKKFESTNLTFENTNTRLKSIFTKEEQNQLKKNNCIVHSHNFSVKTHKIKHIVTDVSKQGKFSLMFEYKKYPFYGVLFHPEKVLYDWEDKNIPKEYFATMLSQKLSIYFINECRKNFNVWIGSPDPNDYFINNYGLYSRRDTYEFLNPETHTFTVPEFISTSYLFGEVDKYYKSEPEPIA